MAPASVANPRFYRALAPQRLDALAHLVGASCVAARGAGQGPDPHMLGARVVCGVDALATAGPDQVSFLVDPKRVPGLDAVRAAGVFVSPAMAAVLFSHAGETAGDGEPAALITDHPQAAFAAASQALVMPRRFEAAMAAPPEGVHFAPGAQVADDALLEPGVWVGPNAVIGPGVKLGADTVVEAGAVVGFADVGARVRIHAGAIIGQLGYGLAPGPSGLVDMPHLGQVIVGDDVTIGANTTIDRGVFTATEIGAGTKIDNLVQIAHNVRIGKHCVLAGCCGLSGSVVLEDGVQLGGAVGVSDHVTIGAGARVAGGTGIVTRDVPAGQTWAGGVPARLRTTFLREMATLSRLARRSSRQGEP